MKKCKNKTKYTCDSAVFDECVEYQGTVNTDSSLVENECITIAESTQDIYDQLENLDLSALGELCLSYTEIAGKNVVKNVLLKFEEKICELEERITELEDRQICDMPIGDCLDLDCLTDACDNDITTYGAFFQALITKVCEP